MPVALNVPGLLLTPPHMEGLRAFAICLDNRCDSLDAHAQRLFPRYRRFSAVDARTSTGAINLDTDPRVSVYFRYHRATRTSHDLLHTYYPGVIGCGLSHIALWQRCVDLGEPIVVMEDDIGALINTDAKRAKVRAAFAAMPSADLHYASIINLPMCSRSRCQGDWCDIASRWDHFGTQMYYITPFAAAKLLEQALPIVTDIDIYMGYVFTVERATLKAKLYRPMINTPSAAARGMPSSIGHYGAESIKRLLPEGDAFYIVVLSVIVVQVALIAMLVLRKQK